MSEIERYRAHNELSPGRALGIVVPLAVAGVAANYALPTLVAAALVIEIVALVAFVVAGVPALVAATRDDYRDTDLSPAQKLSMYAGPFIPVATAPLSALLPDAAGHAGLIAQATWWALGLAWLLWTLPKRSFRIGRRRIAEVLSREPAEVSDRHKAAVCAHGAIMGALVAVGAVDGAVVTGKQLAKVMGVTVDKLKEPLLELDRWGVVKVNRIGLYRESPSWRITVTEVGVWALRR